MAKRLLRIFYPDMPETGVVFSLTDYSSLQTDGTLDHFVVSLTRWSAKQATSPAPGPLDQPFLNLTFDFRPSDGELREYYATGGYFDPKREKTIEDIIYDHPTWDEGRLVLALKEAGMQYGPSDNDKEALLKHLQLPLLARIFGSVRVLSAKCKLRDLVAPEKASPHLNWELYLEFRSASGRKRHYYLNADPITGAVVTFNLDSYSEHKPNPSE